MSTKVLRLGRSDGPIGMTVQESADGLHVSAVVPKAAAQAAQDAEKEAAAEADRKAWRVGGGGARLLVSVAKLCQAPSVLPRHTPSSSTSFRARHRRARAREQLRQIAPLKGRS